MAVTLNDFETIGAFVGRAIKPLQDKIAELEQRKAMVWRGVWRTGVEYHEGDVTQDKGVLHICKAPTSGTRPGSGPGWQMLHKTKAEAK
jgi:hypothetical protein